MVQQRFSPVRFIPRYTVKTSVRFRK